MFRPLMFHNRDSAGSKWRPVLLHWTFICSWNYKLCGYFDHLWHRRPFSALELIRHRAVHDPIRPTVVGVTLKQSRTDPFCKGVNLFLGKMSSDLCLVVALLNYLSTRVPSEGSPLQVQKQLLPDTSVFRRCSKRNAGYGGSQSIGVLLAQLQDRSSHYSSSHRLRRLHDHDLSKMEKLV